MTSLCDDCRGVTTGAIVGKDEEIGYLDAFLGRTDRITIRSLIRTFGGYPMVIATLCAVTLTACGSSGKPSVAEPSASDGTVRVDLEYRRDSAGTALFEAINDRTQVTLSLREPLARGRAAIHAISCFEKGERIFPLTPVVAGRSRTQLDLSLDDVTSQDFAVVVYAGDSDTSVACGRFVAVTRTQPSPERAAAIVACRPPQVGYGFESGACAAIEKLERVRPGVWRVQLRRPPVYCVSFHLDHYGGDANLDVDSVGELSEVRCPPSAYPNEPEADVRAPLRAPSGKPAGVVSLTALGPNQTRVLVETDADWAWISRGRCPARSHTFDLENVYSFRSETTLRVPLQSLLATPHSVLIDGGGAHGGDPLACADLSPPR
jgi:hypothetical protein